MVTAWDHLLITWKHMLLQRPREDTLPSFSLPLCLFVWECVCLCVCEGVAVLSCMRLCMHQCALCVSACRLGASTFSFGLRHVSVYHVLIIVLGHKSHWGILPPCKLILCYYQFTSATLWKWNLAGESNRKVRIIRLDEIIFKKERGGEE